MASSRGSRAGCAIARTARSRPCSRASPPPWSRWSASAAKGRGARGRAGGGEGGGAGGVDWVPDALTRTRIGRDEECCRRRLRRALALAATGLARVCAEPLRARATAATACARPRGSSRRRRRLQGHRRRSERFRMQATALGKYLLYGVDRTSWRVGQPARGGRSPRAEPSERADWRVTESRRGHLHDLLARHGQGAWRRRSGRSCPSTTTAATPFSFVPAEGCAVYPEVGRRARPARRCTGAPRLRRDARPHRRPHAHDGLRVPRRQRCTAGALARVRGAVRARRLPRPLGRRTAAARCSRTCSSATPPAATTPSAGRPSRTGRTTSR